MPTLLSPRRSRFVGRRRRSTAVLIAILALVSTVASADGIPPQFAPESDVAALPARPIPVDELPASLSAALAAAPSPAPVAPVARGGVAFGFAGVDGTPRNGLYYPDPDCQIAVGPGAGAAGRIIESTAGGIAIFDKTGATVVAPVSVETFFSRPAGTVFSPRVHYDRVAGRFFIVAVGGLTHGGQNDLLVAISSDAAPSSLSAGWTPSFAGLGTVIGGSVTVGVARGMATDTNSLVVTANLFNPSFQLAGTKIRFLRKALLVAGTNIPHDIDTAGLAGGFHIQPVQAFGPTDSGRFYLINRLNASFYRLWEVSGGPDAPVLVSNAPQPWFGGTLIASNLGAPQMGTSVGLAHNSGPLLNAVYRDGRIWCATAADADNDGKAEARWYRIATNGGSPNAAVVEAESYLDGADGVEWTFAPAIAVNGVGDAAIVFAQSHSDQFPEMRAAVRDTTDLPGTFQRPFVVATSPGFHDSAAPGTGEPWGTFVSAVVDPDDDASIWIVHEVVATSAVDASIWGSFIARLEEPTPAPIGSTGAFAR